MERQAKVIAMFLRRRWSLGSTQS